MNSTTPDLVDLFHRSTFRAPHRVAIIDGGIRLTYSQLWQRAKTMASNFARMGLSGHAVGIFAPTSADLIAAYYAAFMSSTIIVPINYSFQPGELRNVLLNCPLDVLIVHKSLLKTALSAGDVVERIPIKYLIGGENERTQDFIPFEALEAPCLAPHSKSAEATAAIFHTSGTTGMPKGVVHSLESVSSFAPNYIALSGKEFAPVTLIARNCYHSGGFFHFTGALASGATCILTDNGRGFDADKFLEDLEACSVTQIFLSVSMLNAVLMSRKLSPRAFAAATFISAGADEVKAWHSERLREFTALPLSIRYSSTEATNVSINHRPNWSSPTIGYPHPHFEWRLDSMPGWRGVGELRLRGRAIFKGYLNNPRQNSANFTPEGWYCTGDLFKHDGSSGLEFCGRGCHALKVGGKFVYPEEIEAVANAFPEFEETVAVGVPDPINVQVPVLFARTRRGGNAVLTDRFKAFMAERIAHYKIPVDVIVVAELPKTSAGKIDRAELTRLGTREANKVHAIP